MAHLNDNFALRAPVPVDDRKGWWDGATGEWKPFDSVQHALDTVVYYRYRTLTLPVVENGDVVEYWFKDGVDDSDFVLKTSSADLSNYYTKTELQTSGQAQVHWDNLTNVPSIQSPLTFGNGLYESNGDVKLGLNISTAGVTNDGLITELVGLVFGDVVNEIDYGGIIINPVHNQIEITSIEDSNNLSGFISNPNVIELGKSINGNNISISIDSGGAFITDTVYQRGFGDSDDYSANKTIYSYVTKKMLDEVAGDIPDLTGYATEQWVLDRNYITLAEVPPQIQTDWDATTGLASILNKPNLATVATTGDYNDLINQPSIPDLSGYATETWVQSQGYLTSVPWSFDVNTGDLTIDGTTNNLDGRWLERSEGVITPGYGITVNGDLATGMGIELDTTVVDNRYLRKDVSDSNDSFSLTLGGLTSGDAVFTESVTLETVGTGTGDEVLLYGPGGVIQRKTLTVDGQFGIANASGTKQFDVALGTNLRIAGDGDTSISFNSSTNTVTITSIPGSGTGGVITSVFGRTTSAIVAETGDYNTSQVTESGNLYFTEARVRGTDLAGFTVGSNAAISATDTILGAFGKTQGQINARVPTSRTISISGTSGNITVSGTTTQNLGSNAAWTVNLATAGTAGTYTKVVTDAYGRVTAGGALTVSDLPTDVMQTLSNGNWGQMGYLAISGGNNITVNSISPATTTLGTPQDMIDTKWALSSTSGLLFYSYGSGSSGFNGALGSGIMTSRYSGTTAKTGFLIDRPTTNDDKLYYANIAGNGVLRSWQTFASESWVTSQIPTNYVNTTGNQTGIAGNKTWTGAHSWSSSTNPSSVANTTTIGGTASGQFLRLTQLGSNSISAILRGYSSSGVQLELNEGGVNISTTSLILSNGSPVLTASTNTIVSAPSSGQVYLRPNGASSATNEARFSDNVVLSALSGTGTQMVVANASGVLSRQSIPSVNNGTLTLSTGTGLSGSATFTANQSGNSTFTVSAASGYGIPTTTQISNWNTAYGWGNHASAGYAVSGTGTSQVRTNSQLDARYFQIDKNRPTVDMNDLRISGVYGGGATTSNRPPNTYSYSPFMVLQSGSDRWNQIWFNGYSGDDIIVYRNGSASTWGSWKTIADRDWVNSFGLGTTGRTLAQLGAPSDDMNLIPRSTTGFFYAGNAAANRPVGGSSSYPVGIHIGYNTNIAAQIAVERDGSIYARGSGASDAWNTWKRMWHSGNFNPSDYQTTITGGASTITSSNLTASRALTSNTAGKVTVSSTTSTELGYLSGATSNIQTQLNGKASTSHTHNASDITSGTLAIARIPTGTTSSTVALGNHTHTFASITSKPTTLSGYGITDAQSTITGGASTITSSNLTANRALISNGSGKVAVSAVTSTELGYLDGVTSAIQTQLNARVPTSRTVNGKALSANISLTASDVSAVPLSGNATISGTKTFSSPVVVPNATASNHAVNLGQLNALVPQAASYGQYLLPWVVQGRRSGIDPTTGTYYVGAILQSVTQTRFWANVLPNSFINDGDAVIIEGTLTVNRDVMVGNPTSILRIGDDITMPLPQPSSSLGAGYDVNYKLRVMMSKNVDVIYITVTMEAHAGNFDGGSYNYTETTFSSMGVPGSSNVLLRIGVNTTSGANVRLGGVSVVHHSGYSD